MKRSFITLAVALSFGFAGSAMAKTEVQYKAEKNRISSDYKMAKDKCGALKANAKDICMSEAKGAEKIAKAEAESGYKPTASNTEKVAMVKADAMYDTAKEKCDDLSANAKDVCVKDAKVVHTKAKDDAKIAKVSMDSSKGKSDKTAEVKKDAKADENKAMYKAANERCDALSGAPKDSCQADAKAKYRM